jgi:hypothetical protein
LRRALDLAEEAAFVPDGFLSWLNAIRPDGEPEATADEMMSAEAFANGLEELFRQRLGWWGP